jgi:hypothetical protein
MEILLVGTAFKEGQIRCPETFKTVPDAIVEFIKSRATEVLFIFR